MELFKISVVVLLTLYIVVAGRAVWAGVYKLCEKDDIISSNGIISFNSSSLGPEGNAITCEKIIYAQTQDRVKLTMTKMSLGNSDVFEVFNGPSGGEKIAPMDSKGQKIYETTGNILKIVLKIQKSPSSSGLSSSLEGTFTTVGVPFHATCHCPNIQNGYSKCYEVQSEMKCSFYCKDNFVDLFNTTGNYTCNLLNGKWNAEYKKIGCVSVDLAPEINTWANFTLSEPVCQSINNSTISELFRSHLFLPQKELFQNGVCLQKNYSHCLDFNCVDKDNKSFVLVTIKDKAISNAAHQTVHVNSKRLNHAYVLNETDIRAIASALIKNLNDSRIVVNDVKLLENPELECPKGTLLIDLPNKQGHACTKCPRGTLYKSDVRTCKICGNSSSIKCPSEAGSDHVSPQSTCEIKCMPGKRLLSRFCQWCPYNTYQNSSKVINPVCLNCSEPRKTLYPGRASLDDCYKSCQKGESFDENSKSCLACPLGTYLDDIDRLYTWCKQCKAGMVTYANGSKHQSDCVPSCKKGHFFDDIMKNCSKCKIGWYQEKENQLVCLQCPSATSTQVEGSANVSACIKTCPKGTYLNEHDRSCSKCPLGTYMERDGHLQFACKKCGSTKTTYVKGASSSAECFDTCKGGQFFNSHSSVCQNCSLGNYQNKENQLNCIQCPIGTSTQAEASSTLSDCIKTCQKGNYINTQNRTCANCPFGTYMDKDEHLLPTCKKCPAGKTTYVSGVSDEAQCLDICKVGHYFNSSLSSCQVCPQGTFQSKTQQQNCMTCPPGLNTKRSGATSNLECIKFVCNQGEYLNPQSGDCLLCGNGTYQSAFNHNMTTCQSCRSGKTKSKGSKDENACITTCNSFPCENGADCSDTSEGFSCKCPRGVTGKRCDVFEKKEELQEVQVSIRFLSLEWNEDLADPSTAAFKEVSYSIEKSLSNIGKEIIAVKVHRLSSGSVIADIDIYTNDNASLVPAKSLQAAVAQGSIGGLLVDREHFNIRQVTCSQALGMENERIQDEQITASSTKDGKGRLNGKAWYALQVDEGKYLQVRFHGIVNISAIATQGDSNGAFVKTYTISYSIDGDAWTDSLDINYKTKIYHANSTSISKQDLQQPITSAKYIRVNPLTWEKTLSMRIELYGCLSDPVLQKVAPKATTQPPDSETKTEPDILGSKDKEEDEYAWGKYLGISFGLILVAGVVVASFLWWRSSKKKKQKENAPLVLTRFQDGSYREMEKNPNDEEDDVV